MPATYRTRLAALSEREYRREAGGPVRQPAARRFRGLRLNLSRYDAAWDRKRGGAARLMAVLLRENDEQLTQRVCRDAKAAATYRGAADWLASESRLVHTHARHLQTAADRLTVVLQRCGTAQEAGGSTASLPTSSA